MNLQRIISEIRKQDPTIRIVFMTQPVSYRSDMSDKEKELLWFGWTQKGDYCSICVMNELIKEYNDVVVNLSKDNGVICVDMNRKLRHDSRMFYDDVHFNDEGARRVASCIYEQIKSIITR